MRLRAHHLLCSQGFKGLGYSQRFVDNFWAVIGRIRSDPQLLVEIVSQPDVICAHCPHLQGDACQKSGPESEQRVSSMDNRVIGHLGISVGYRYPIEDVFKLMKMHIHSEERKQICSGCEWIEHCF